MQFSNCNLQISCNIIKIFEINDQNLEEGCI